MLLCNADRGGIVQTESNHPIEEPNYILIVETDMVRAGYHQLLFGGRARNQVVITIDPGGKYIAVVAADLHLYRHRYQCAILRGAHEVLSQRAVVRPRRQCDNSVDLGIGTRRLNHARSTHGVPHHSKFVCIEQTAYRGETPCILTLERGDSLVAALCPLLRIHGERVGRRKAYGYISV